MDASTPKKRSWENLEYWIRTITPVAEEEGIRLGIHPCDPPVESLAGIPQLFRSYGNYRRYLDIVDSPHNAIEFCQGTISEMADSTGDNIYGFIKEMVERDRVIYVHLRNVSGANPESFNEEFINTGHVDMYRAMKIYYEAGCDGFFIEDRVPHTHGDHALGPPRPSVRERLHSGDDRGGHEGGRRRMTALDDFMPLRSEVEEMLGAGLDALGADPIPVLASEKRQSEACPLWALRIGDRGVVSARDRWVEPLQAVVDRLAPEELFSVFGAYEMARITWPDGTGIWGPRWYYVGDDRTFDPPDDDRPVQLTQDHWPKPSTSTFSGTALNTERSWDSAFSKMTRSRRWPPSTPSTKRSGKYVWRSHAELPSHRVPGAYFTETDMPYVRLDRFLVPPRNRWANPVDRRFTKGQGPVSVETNHRLG